MEESASKGVLGERIAALYLELMGCAVLDRNFRFAHCEIDLIVRDGPCVAFVEVKTRSGSSFGEAMDAVGPGKLRNVRAAARGYLLAAPAGSRASEYRFDLVAIDCDPLKGEMRVRHLKGIA